MRYYLETNVDRMCSPINIVMCIFYMICVFKIIQPGTEFRSKASSSQPWCPASRHPVLDPTWPWFLIAQVCYHSLWSVFSQGPWYSGNEKWENIYWPNGTSLQYSCLENPMNGGAWWAAVHGVAKSWTRLSDFTFTFHFYALEKEMATHSSVLAWRIPGTGEPGGLPSLGSHRVRHDWSDLAAAAAAATLTKERFQGTLVLWDIPEKKNVASCYQIIMGNNTYAPPPFKWSLYTFTY